jgi:hypothetical protein
MTPREKAIELVDKFKDYSIKDIWNEKNYNAIECALIAVDEILSSQSAFAGHVWHKSIVRYYTEVKQEIEKL